MLKPMAKVTIIQKTLFIIRHFYKRFFMMSAATSFRALTLKLAMCAIEGNDNNTAKFEESITCWVTARRSLYSTCRKCELGFSLTLSSVISDFITS